MSSHCAGPWRKDLKDMQRSERESSTPVTNINNKPVKGNAKGVLYKVDYSCVCTYCIMGNFDMVQILMVLTDGSHTTKIKTVNLKVKRCCLYSVTTYC